MTPTSEKIEATAVPGDLRFEHKAQSMSIIRSMGILTHIDRPVRELLVKLANEVDDLRASAAQATRLTGG